MSGALVIFLISLSSYGALSQSVFQCEIGLNRDLPIKVDPVLFGRNTTQRLNFIIPVNVGSDDYIRLLVGQEMVLACAGSRNYLVPTNTAEARSFCVANQTLSINGTNYNIADLVCSSKTTPTLVNTQKTCASTGSLVQIGYNVEIWNYLVQTCHDIAGSGSYYSVHTILGSNLPGKVRMSYRPSFLTGGSPYYSTFSPDNAYTQATQAATFQTLVGPNSAQTYIQPSKNLYLARGHLAPDADFIYSSWQILTYFYINAAPQWQVINTGNWVILENAIRAKAENIKADLTVVTGTFRVLKLANDNGQLVPMSLETSGKLPVPELFWKAVRNPKDNSCIVFVSTNNPFLTTPPTKICPDICASNGWPVLQTNLTRGYIYCCTYSSFKAAVTYIPAATCSSVLKK